MFITDFYDNGDQKEDGSSIYTGQSIKLHSYCNSAQIDLCGIQITSKLLRELANELDEAYILAKQNVK